METRSRSRGNGGQPSGSSYSSRKLAHIYLIKWVAAFSFGILHTFLVNLFYKRVPDPYMDEIFHVNQTREYCNGNFTYWNQMITTPPLIYVIAAWTGFCGRERFLNSAIIPLTFVGLTRLRLSRSTRNNFQDAILCSIAILLLPVLFETSILFYTDLLSLTLVTYGLGTASPTLAALVFTFSVFSRQTNIVWAAFYCLCNLQNEFDAKKPFTSTFRCVLRHRAFAVLGFGFLLFMLTNNGVVLGDRTAHRMHFHLPHATILASGTSSHLSKLCDLHVHWSADGAGRPSILLRKHPYLLADNRHFTFYIWRRWFLKDPIYKFVTIPFYIVSFAFIYVALKHVRLFTLLCGVISVCLCLIPAHLVEFRYYIIPYSIARINFHQNNTLLVCLEILAHVVVNFFTIDLFLNRPFVWANEPENVQRFMCKSTTMFLSVSMASSKGHDIDQADGMVIERLVNQNNTCVSFFAILSGHNGREAVKHVTKTLWPTIKEMINFETANDQDVLDAMKDAFWKIQEDMQEKAADWPRRVSEAHVQLTTDHKTSDPDERRRIEKAGGQLFGDAIQPTLNFDLTIKGDYWSYNEETQKYMVSPEPQCLVHVINKNEDKVVLLLSSKTAVMPKMPSNFAQLLLRDARGSYGALQRDDMSIICVRFHNNDMKFPSELRPLVGRPIIKHLIDYPQDIVRAPSNDDIVNLTPLVCCPEKDQAAVRRVKSDRRTIAGHYYPLSQQSMPGTSQMGSSGPRIDTYHLSELKATTSGYTTPKERTPTSDKESRMLDILCTPLRKKPRPQALPLSPTAGKKVELQDRSPKPKPPSKRKLDFSSDEGTSG
ncbi:Dol-P-Glc:Glc(2)Man(9)GlcNAc(2)-PP-Dol alpha-1,2-glucosyltransferase [Aphelenchoides besseyi]|nr:Dol-P-Glc:Glc(2)Man(9)GlcNAc(2)-PP-Dol alpha-1,2-glucosyltransferase [Aphelenchoides besseyi]